MTTKVQHQYCSAVDRAQSLATILMLALFIPANVFAAKVDTVELENGNLVTGEIKELRQGRLKYSTDSMGTVYIEWGEVIHLTGKARYRVETTDGRIHFGSITPGTDDGSMVVVANGETTQLEVADVFRITKIKTGWRDKIDSDIAVGYRYAKASDIKEITLGYDGTLTTDRYRLDFGANGRSTEDSEDTTTQWLAYTDLRRWRENRNYWLATGGAEQNDELGIDLRVIAGAGLGRRLRQTTRWQLAAEAAPIVNYTENDDGSSDTELEALLRANWQIYIYDSPKRTLDTTLALFPGITQAGEYRSAFDITLRQEFIKDLFWDLSFYHQYDSDVEDEDASNSDYGVKTSIGFEF